MVLLDLGIPFYVRTLFRFEAITCMYDWFTCERHGALGFLFLAIRPRLPGPYRTFTKSTSL
jgi:hypothetical protein